MLNTPILFLIFNRPEITQRVFLEIKKQKPRYLFVAADGPRQGNEQDLENCKRTRDLVIKSIDWDCEINTLFREENLGCGLAVSSAIDWFFQHVDKGIILEDDCLPHESFFGYCETLLEKYEYCENISVVSGNNFQNGIKRGNASYYFSIYSHNWGWATWRRAWVNYDFKLTQLEDFISNNRIRNIDNRLVFKNYWLCKFQDAKNGDFVHIWDYQWLFTLWNLERLTILPNVNLISNIGFGDNATHTLQKESTFANMTTNDIGCIKHPKKIELHKKADRYTSINMFHIVHKYSWKNIRKKLLLKSKKLLSKF
ncbi:nucleotide-diphospho-sugar transferase [Flavobacterium sp. SOK18b]|nr:nucleotide-diphospho-sugar transferase [Flavobacterium sp. SOK18b]